MGYALKASDALAKFLVVHQVQTCFELVGGMVTHLLDNFTECRPRLAFGSKLDEQFSKLNG
jgi:thiamine pyrophosphate-dependent acetolactate synthase large subunit-like protein